VLVALQVTKLAAHVGENSGFTLARQAPPQHSALVAHGKNCPIHGGDVVGTPVVVVVVVVG
jgi:hypothetical protein